MYVIEGYQARISPEGDGYYTISLPRGKTVILSGEQSVKLQFDCLYSKSGAGNFYGVKLGKGLPKQMDWSDSAKAAGKR